jgi:hypothetical protein
MGIGMQWWQQQVPAHSRRQQPPRGLLLQMLCRVQGSVLLAAPVQVLGRTLKPFSQRLLLLLVPVLVLALLLAHLQRLHQQQQTLVLVLLVLHAAVLMLMCTGQGLQGLGLMLGIWTCQMHHQSLMLC